MAGSTAAPFTPPAIPWCHPQPLDPSPELGPGLDPHRCGAALARLCAELDVQAVVVFGSRQPQLPPTDRLACWRRFHGALGRLGVKVDLVMAGNADAQRLSGSRWHVFGDVAREGRVLYVAAAVCG
jgi:hypothetical protein